VTPRTCPRGAQSRAPRAVPADLTDGTSSNMDRRVTIALICATIATLVSTSGATQQLVLTADVGKTEFFEEEPIYLLVRLQNVGTDTAWSYFFSFFSPAMTLSVRLGHGHLVEVTKPILDHRWTPPGEESLFRQARAF